MLKYLCISYFNEFNYIFIHSCQWKENATNYVEHCIVLSILNIQIMMIINKILNSKRSFVGSKFLFCLFIRSIVRKKICLKKCLYLKNGSSECKKRVHIPHIANLCDRLKMSTIYFFEPEYFFFELSNNRTNIDRMNDEFRLSVIETNKMKRLFF